MKSTIRAAIVVLGAALTVAAQYGDTSSTYSYYSSGYPAQSAGVGERKFGLYIGMGYGFGVGGSEAGTSVLIDQTGQELEEEDHFINYGRGLKIEGGVSYRFLENVRARVGVQFTSGIPRLEVVEDDREDAIVTEVEYRWTSFGVKAMVVPRFEVFGLLDMYAGVGLGFFLTGSSFNVTRTGGLSAKGEFDNRGTLGFLGVYGVDFPIAENAMLFGELNLEAMRVAATQLRIYESNFQGGRYESDTENYEDDAIDRDARPRTPATNVSIRAGIRFDLF